MYILLFSFLSLSKAALITSAYSFFLLREHHCENTSREALTLSEEACPFSKNRAELTEQQTTKRRAAMERRNAVPVSTHSWMNYMDTTQTTTPLSSS